MYHYPKPVTKHFIKKILNQMENFFFKINEQDNKFDMGFFCHIKIKNETIPVIIINNYKINSDIINVYKNNKDKKTIELGGVRYNDKEYNISILEIKSIKNYNFPFYDIDDDIYLNDSIVYYHKKQPIYTIQYKKDNENLVSYNTISDMNIKYIKISHDLIDKNELSLLFNFYNNKLIGIHNKNFNCPNKGLFIKFIIDKFIQNYENKNNYNNEISMVLNIDKNDINKDIYFLDNYKYILGQKHLYELTKFNTKIYINNQEYSYKKYFKFEKEGKNNIQIKFNIKLKDCSYMFAGCKNIISIDLTNFKSENVENMDYMFYNCQNLKNINLFSIKTEKVNNMNYMFYGCNNIKVLDLSSFIIKKNINMVNIFGNSGELNYFNFYSLKYKNNDNKNDISKTKFLKKSEEILVKDEYNICFVGECGIGAKTSLINRIVCNEYEPSIPCTNGVSYSSIEFELKSGKIVKLNLWDIAGQEIYKSLNLFFMKDSDCIVIGFDITVKKTFEKVKEYWYPTVKAVLNTNLIYLIGNKIDDYEHEFDLEEAKNFAVENNLRYFEISCRHRIGIDDFLYDLKNEIITI